MLLTAEKHKSKLHKILPEAIMMATNTKEKKRTTIVSEDAEWLEVSKLLQEYKTMYPLWKIVQESFKMLVGSPFIQKVFLCRCQRKGLSRSMQKLLY